MENIQSKFSDKVKHLEASAIREIFKLLAKPGIISFAEAHRTRTSSPRKSWRRLPPTS